jgi:release factor glutamine methyltransferase
MTIRELLEGARQMLAGQDAERLESEILLAHVLGENRAFLYANPERKISPGPLAEFLELVRRRASGEPIAYLIGRQEFWSLPLQVTPDVLIPRPETELLIEAALERIPDHEDQRVADLGTGSGAIALAIAAERVACEVHATEESVAAITVARQNARALKLERVHFHDGSWLKPLSGSFDVILSNPPYIAADDPHLQQGDCRFEPKSALTPGSDGMTAIRYIAHASLPFLRTGGWLLFEHGFDQGAQSRKLLAALGYRGVETLEDLEGRERVTLGRKP